MSFEAGKPTMFSNVGNISMYEVSWLDSVPGLIFSGYFTTEIALTPPSH